MIALLILAMIGFCISLYAYFIEQKIKTEPDYKAACDISDAVSCTKTIKSGYGNLFFISNALIGMLFYVIVGVLAFIQAYTLLLIAAIISCIASLILAYILFAKIKTLCLLCTSLYIINFIILLVVLLKFY